MTTTMYECQNCGKAWTEEQLTNPIHRYHERVGPDEPEPAGECPGCGALCHEQDEIGKCVDCGTQCVADGSLAVVCPKCDTAPGRIDILAWRRHGDDESTIEVALVPAEADEDAARVALAEINHVVFGLDDNAEVPEGKSRAYVIEDLVIRDGQTFTVQNDRTFQITIREVTR